jgi:hypothetical protein
MKKILPIFFMAALLCSASNSFGQEREKILAESEVKDVFAKKFRWGLSWNQYWGSITGTDLPREYFAKPCMGTTLRAQYNFLPFLGASVGFGFQQRGSGIINDDKVGGAFTHPWEEPMYDADSTYRERLRFKGWEVPVALELRTPTDVVKGVRLSGSAGVSWYASSEVKTYFLSVEDGYHKITDVSNDYLKNDIAMQLSIGADINAGGSCVLQAHFIYTKSTNNVYLTGTGDGRLKTIGFRISCLF